ncbi:LysR family transcriptional regulator [Saccharopolyspora sp. 5N708]|uniref:LysR family transcriptional regulator n=1 Tax=Saccharopolyspora sp. 5N708 TaxID=3457424 RepID=UPI003FD31385
MELRHLRYFVAVAEQLHFGRAAQQLGIKQPPLSQQIRALEDDLGVALLDRSSRRVRLTPAGATLLPAARQILTAAQSARQVTRNAGRGETGELVVGFVGSATLTLLPLALRRFRDRYPRVVLTLREMTTAEQVRALRDGILDVGLLRPPLPLGDTETIDVESVGSERLLVALPTDHPLAAERSIAAQRLAAEPFVLFPRELGAGLHDQILSYCNEVGFTPTIAQEAVQMQTIVALVAGGLGISMVPSSVARQRRPDVVYRQLRPATRIVHLGAAHRPDNLNPAARNFRTIIQELVTP